MAKAEVKRHFEARGGVDPLLLTLKIKEATCQAVLSASRSCERPQADSRPWT